MDNAKVTEWHRPPHPSMVGKSFAELALQSSSSSTIPLWTGQDSGYTFMMVGLDPTVAQKNPVSTIKAQLIPIKFVFSGSTTNVFDPTKKDACTQKSAVAMVKASPIFKSVDLSAGGTALGKGQFVSLFQRANFFTYTGPGSINPKYEVNLSETALSEITVKVSGGYTAQGTCDTIGFIEVNAWDSFVLNTLLPQLASHGVGPTTLPIFLFYNVVMYDTSIGNCCILGYHGAFMSQTSGALQTYAVVDYDESGYFDSSVQDITIMSHEIAEWMDDPTGNNPTPSWGNIGQVSGCQSNLEVGDPLSGTLESPSNSPTPYHVQDLAFKSWFYHDATSSGVNGWYSLFGTFTTFAASCK
jgi:hypothetical protein